MHNRPINSSLDEQNIRLTDDVKAPSESPLLKPLDASETESESALPIYSVPEGERTIEPEGVIGENDRKPVTGTATMDTPEIMDIEISSLSHRIWAGDLEQIEVTELVKLKKTRNWLGVIFALSAMSMLFFCMLIDTPADGWQSLDGNLSITSLIPLLISISSLIGFISTAVLEWRKDHRESLSHAIELKKMMLEIKYLRRQIDSKTNK